MGEWLAGMTVAEALLGGAAVVSAGASIAAGVQQARAAEIEARQYEDERRNAATAAEQDEAERRRELARTLAAQEAMRAGRGTELFSQNALNIRQQTIAAAEDDINTSRLNFLSRQRRYALGAQGARSSATGALIGGFADATGTLATTAARGGLFED